MIYAMRIKFLFISLLCLVQGFAAFKPTNDRVYKFTHECVRMSPLDNDSAGSHYHLMGFKYLSADTHSVSRYRDTLIICEGVNTTNTIDTICYYIIDSNTLKKDSAYVYVTSLLQKISNTVYPGDANGDGLVSIHDYFFWGDRMGQQVTPRYMVSDDWKPFAMPLTEWKDTTIFNTKTFLADGDGDGEISINDALPLLNNFGKGHAFGEKFDYNAYTNFSYPIVPVRFDIQDIPIIKGNFLDIDVMVGEPGPPLKDITGFGFSMEVYTMENQTKRYLKMNSFFLPFNSWIKSGGWQDFNTYAPIDSGRYFSVELLTNRKTAEGSGSTGQVRIIIDDLIIQNLSTGKDIYLDFKETALVGSVPERFLRTAVKNDTLKAITSGISSVENTRCMVYQKENMLHVTKSILSQNQTSYVLVRNMLGVPVMKESFNDYTLVLNMNQLSAGAYIVQVVEHDKTLYTQRITK